MPDPSLPILEVLPNRQNRHKLLKCLCSCGREIVIRKDNYDKRQPTSCRHCKEEVPQPVPQIDNVPHVPQEKVPQPVPQIIYKETIKEIEVNPYEDLSYEAQKTIRKIADLDTEEEYREQDYGSLRELLDSWQKHKQRRD